MLPRRPRSGSSQRGSALLMAFLMVILLYAIVFQLAYSTKADLRVAQNDVTTTQMDLAIESAFQEVYDRLKQDSEAGGASGSGGGAMPGDTSGQVPGTEGAGGQGGGEEQQAPSDSREDSWGRPQRTTIGEIELRILVQDEDSKINVLQLLAEDEEQADQAMDRVVRVIDTFRDGSTVDIDRSDAIRIAESMRQHLRDRTHSALPKPKLLSDDEEKADIGMPLTFKEFEVLERFDDGLFRDFRDERGYIVHSLGAYLTVWTSLQSGSGGGSGSGSGGSNSNQQNGSTSGNDQNGQNGEGDANNQGDSSNGGTNNGQNAGGGAGGGAEEPNWGMAVNVNTAPVAVLKALMDDRDVPTRFWDGVVEYRNLEEKKDDKAGSDETAEEPALDEYGNEILKRQIFDSLDELSEVDGYEGLEERVRNDLSQLLSTQSHVFSIYVTARKKTGSQQDDEFGGYLGARREEEGREDPRGKGLVRTVRSVVWRYQSGDEVKIIPIVRWEVVDYTPFEVVDYPDDKR